MARLPQPEISGDYIIPGQPARRKKKAGNKGVYRRLRTYIPPYLFFMMSLYLVQMVIFFGFRLVFLFSNYQKIDPGSFKFLKLVLFYGFRFDTIVSCSIMLVPFIFLSVDYFFEWNRRWFYKVIKIYLRVLLVLSFLICSADIPFFAFFNSRLTSSVLLWKDNAGDMMRFVLTDPAKYPYMLILLLSSVVFIYVLVRLQGRLFNENINKIHHPVRQKTIVVTVFSCMMIIGLRGGIAENPLTLTNLTTSNHFFINQLSWNPIISFIDSFNGFPLDYLEPDQAVSHAGRFLGGEDGFQSPIARKREFAGEPVKANIVLVILESMSAIKMGLFGNTKNLTPNLDTLARRGLFFDNFYTAGIHTCNGIYGTLFSFPSLMNEHPMNNLQSTHQEFAGMYQTLSQHNYQTAFITTNDENFDNMGYFVRNNGCQYVYGMKDFPKDKIVNSWGPADETLFDFSLDKINRLAREEAPFFATLVTITTHEPYTLPAWSEFKSANVNSMDRSYAYSDWCIGRFMDSCRQQPWFSNTLFVFLADHGINSKSPFEIPLSFHHSPLIIYGPGLVREPRTISSMSMQADVFPTLMGLLQLPYVNNTFGVDLLHEKRPYAYFTHDDKLGCLDEKHYLIVDKQGKRSLYPYTNTDASDCLNEKSALADSMQIYSMSMLQTAQWMLLNKKAGVQYKLN